jgi:hypothetical protein
MISNVGVRAARWGLAAMLVVSAGCGKPSVVRFPVGGSVSVKGNDKLSGSISFEPIVRGPAATTALENGRYQFDRRNGPAAGRHRVVVVEPGNKFANEPSVQFTCETEVPTEEPFERNFNF